MRYSSPQTSADSLDRYLFWGLLASLLAHVALAIILSDRSAPLPPAAIVIDIISEPPVRTREPGAAPKQIVSTPERTDDTPPPPNTRLLAERDFSTDREQVKRGDAPDAGRAVGKRVPSAAPRQAAGIPKQEPIKPMPQERPAEQPKIKQLALDRQTLLENFAAPKPQNEQRENSPTGAERGPYQAFSRPAGTGAAFVGNAGVPDYLPNLPDGDLTLLNAKANLYAVFVRRVATQVFGNLRSSGWASLSFGDIQKIGDFVMVRAVLSPQGKLLRVELESPSGSGRFDDAVKRAVESGARDPNPPKGAEAKDGNIHFIFKARSWSQFAAAPRTGAPMERRWLLLGTGLE